MNTFGMTAMEKLIYFTTGIEAYIEKQCGLLELRRWDFGFEVEESAGNRSHFVWCGPWYIVFGRVRR